MSKLDKPLRKKLSRLHLRPNDVLLVHDDDVFRRIKAAEESGNPVFPFPIMILRVERDAWTHMTFEQQAEVFLKAADEIKRQLQEQAEAQRAVENKPPDEPLVKIVEE